MVRSTAFASFAALAALAVAPLAARADGVVGGGAATISGGGDNMVITYATGGAGGGSALREQPGRVARFASGQGEGGPRLEYLTPAPSDAGREARLVGGGDNAEVVYK
jgi:hypothetical protein